MSEVQTEDRDRLASGAHGTSLRYVAEGWGPAVMLVHGVGANLESWDEIAVELARTRRVLRADLRGHGRSGRITECAMDDFVEDVAAVLADAGEPNADLVGFSLGGLIGQHVATKRPELVRRLVLISSVADRTEAERARIVERAALVRKEGIASVAAAAADRWFTPAFRNAHPEVIEARLAELVANDLPSYAAAYLAFGLGDEGLRPEAIRCPTLIATGEFDQGSNVRMQRFLHGGIAGSELVILPGLRHSVLLEASGLIARMVLGFLERP